MYIPISGYAPDAEPSTPGVLLDTEMMIPTLNGVAALPADADAGVAATPSAVASMVTLRDLAGNNLIFAGGAASLAKLATTTWTDVTRTSGGAYSSTAAARWTFAQFDARSLAANRGDKLQKFDTGDSDFSDVTDGPKAAFVSVSKNFVMVANTKGGPGGSDTYGDSPNRWWCCAIGNSNSWTANVSTQATSGLLQDTPGEIVGLHALGSGFVAYKENSMYLARYVGPPRVWEWSQVPGEGMGAPSHYSVVNIETAHLFIGRDNVYMFDPSGPRPLADNRVAESLLADINVKHQNRLVGFQDRNTWRAYWFYPSVGSNDGTLDKYICFNYRSNRWTRGTKTVRFAFEYREPGVSYNDLGSYYSTYADLPTAPYDTAFASTSTYKPAIVDSNDKIQRLEGSPANASSMTTWDIGQDGTPTLVTRIRPRFKRSPTTGTQTYMYKDNLGDTVTTSVQSTLFSGTFDHVESARWHRVKHNYTGDVEVTGVDIEIQGDGLE